MCIFCGGKCCGTGDVLMPVIGFGAAYAVSKIKAKSLKNKNDNN